MNINRSIDAPVIWLTGASSGIGRATALEAARRGYRVALTARRTELLEELRGEICAAGGSAGKILLAPADVTDPVQLKSAFDLLCSGFGRIDILCAGAGLHVPSDAESFDVAAYRQLFDLNLFGVLNCIQLVLPQMQKRKSGHIAGISSVAGYRALPTAAAYGASKAALTYFLESLRFDLDRFGIAVTVISPGFVKTPQTDKNEFPMPCIIAADVAARKIMDGIERRAYEVHFPWRFTIFLKLLRLLPIRLYHLLVSRSVLR